MQSAGSGRSLNASNKQHLRAPINPLQSNSCVRPPNCQLGVSVWMLEQWPIADRLHFRPKSGSKLEQKWLIMMDKGEPWKLWDNSDNSRKVKKSKGWTFIQEEDKQSHRAQRSIMPNRIHHMTMKRWKMIILKFSFQRDESEGGLGILTRDLLLVWIFYQTATRCSEYRRRRRLANDKERRVSLKEVLLKEAKNWKERDFWKRSRGFLLKQGSNYFVYDFSLDF